MNSNPNAILEVARITHAHGIRGEVFAQIRGPADWSVDPIQWRLRRPDGQCKTLNLEHKSPHKTGFILKFREISDRTTAESYRGSVVEIESAALVSKPGESIYLHELRDFEVFDGDRRVGIIRGFSTNGPQDLLLVSVERGETTIPLVKAFLEEIDMGARVVRMRLPDGLTDFVV